MNLSNCVTRWGYGLIQLGVLHPVAGASGERITMGIALHQALSRFGCRSTDYGDLGTVSDQVMVPYDQSDLTVDYGKRRNTVMTANLSEQKMDLHLEKGRMYQHI